MNTSMIELAPSAPAARIEGPPPAHSEEFAQTLGQAQGPPGPEPPPSTTGGADEATNEPIAQSKIQDGPNEIQIETIAASMTPVTNVAFDPIPQAVAAKPQPAEAGQTAPVSGPSIIVQTAASVPQLGLPIESEESVDVIPSKPDSQVSKPGEINLPNEGPSGPNGAMEPPDEDISPDRDPLPDSPDRDPVVLDPDRDPLPDSPDRDACDFGHSVGPAGKNEGKGPNIASGNNPPRFDLDHVKDVKSMSVQASRAPEASQAPDASKMASIPNLKIQEAVVATQSESEGVDLLKVKRSPKGADLIDFKAINIPNRAENKQTVAATVEAKPSTMDLQVVNKVIRQVVDHVESLLAARPKAGVTIHLEPRELGTITLNVRSQGTEVETTITASNSQVRDALQTSQSHLRQQMADRGIEVAKLDIQASTQHRSDSQRPHQEAAKPRFDASRPGASSERADFDMAATRSIRRMGRDVDLWI